MDEKMFIKSLIARQNESEILEFKEAKNQYDFNKIGKYFSALSNEANLKGKEYAWLIFGVRGKDKSYVNTKFRTNPSDLQSLKREIADHTTKRITFIDIHEIILGGKRILAFQIPAAPQGIPIAWKGHYYGRDGESLHPLNIEEIERIRRQPEVDWSVQVIDAADIGDLSKDAIRQARELFKVKNPRLRKQIEQWSDITFLNKAKIVTI